VKRQIILVALVVGIVVGFVSCKRNASNSQEQKKIDSLFLGISMGMEKKAFYDYCWEMNKQKFFKHGPTNQSVEYRLEGELTHPVFMQFYPSFYNEKIYEMPVLFSYESWAPWNKEYSADTLLVNILPMFRKWYGDDFKKLDHPTQGVVYYQMKGRRRINLFVRDDQFVQAVFTDLKIEKEIKELKDAE
jgi:hypothetical protein